VPIRPNSPTRVAVWLRPIPPTKHRDRPSQHSPAGAAQAWLARHPQGAPANGRVALLPAADCLGGLLPVRTLPLDGVASRPTGTALARAIGWLVKSGEPSQAPSRPGPAGTGHGGARPVDSEKPHPVLLGSDVLSVSWRRTCGALMAVLTGTTSHQPSASSTPAGARSPSRTPGLQSLRVLTGWWLCRNLPSKARAAHWVSSPSIPSILLGVPDVSRLRPVQGSLSKAREELGFAAQSKATERLFGRGRQSANPRITGGLVSHFQGRSDAPSTGVDPGGCRSFRW
jgi:hypothetical protein